jgi:hypothetical protein
LEDYSGDSRNPRSIDGIILTKFDTVDDKVIRSTLLFFALLLITFTFPFFFSLKDQ